MQEFMPIPEKYTGSSKAATDKIAETSANKSPVPSSVEVTSTPEQEATALKRIKQRFFRRKPTEAPPSDEYTQVDLPTKDSANTEPSGEPQNSNNEAAPRRIRIQALGDEEKSAVMQLREARRLAKAHQEEQLKAIGPKMKFRFDQEEVTETPDEQKKKSSKTFTTLGKVAKLVAYDARVLAQMIADPRVISARMKVEASGYGANLTEAIALYQEQHNGAVPEDVSQLPQITKANKAEANAAYNKLVRRADEETQANQPEAIYVSLAQLAEKNTAARDLGNTINEQLLQPMVVRLQQVTDVSQRQVLLAEERQKVEQALYTFSADLELAAENNPDAAELHALLQKKHIGIQQLTEAVMNGGEQSASDESRTAPDALESLRQEIDIVLVSTQSRLESQSLLHKFNERIYHDTDARWRAVGRAKDIVESAATMGKGAASVVTAGLVLGGFAGIVSTAAPVIAGGVTATLIGANVAARVSRSLETSAEDIRRLEAQRAQAERKPTPESSPPIAAPTSETVSAEQESIVPPVPETAKKENQLLRRIKPVARLLTREGRAEATVKYATRHITEADELTKNAHETLVTIQSAENLEQMRPAIAELARSQAIRGLERDYEGREFVAHGNKVQLLQQEVEWALALEDKTAQMPELATAVKTALDEETLRWRQDIEGKLRWDRLINISIASLRAGTAAAITGGAISEGAKLAGEGIAAAAAAIRHIDGSALESVASQIFAPISIEAHAHALAPEHFEGTATTFNETLIPSNPHPTTTLQIVEGHDKSLLLEQTAIGDGKGAKNIARVYKLVPNTDSHHPNTYLAYRTDLENHPDAITDGKDKILIDQKQVTDLLHKSGKPGSDALLGEGSIIAPLDINNDDLLTQIQKIDSNLTIHTGTEFYSKGEGTIFYIDTGDAKNIVNVRLHTPYDVNDNRHITINYRDDAGKLQSVTEILGTGKQGTTILSSLDGKQTIPLNITAGTAPVQVDEFAHQFASADTHILPDAPKYPQVHLALRSDKMEVSLDKHMVDPHSSDSSYETIFNDIKSRGEKECMQINLGNNQHIYIPTDSHGAIIMTDNVEVFTPSGTNWITGQHAQDLLRTYGHQIVSAKIDPNRNHVLQARLMTSEEWWQPHNEAVNATQIDTRDIKIDKSVLHQLAPQQKSNYGDGAGGVFDKTKKTVPQPKHTDWIEQAWQDLSQWEENNRGEVLLASFSLVAVGSGLRLATRTSRPARIARLVGNTLTIAALPLVGVDAFTTAMAPFHEAIDFAPHGVIIALPLIATAARVAMERRTNTPPDLTSYLTALQTANQNLNAYQRYQLAQIMPRIERSYPNKTPDEIAEDMNIYLLAHPTAGAGDVNLAIRRQYRDEKRARNPGVSGHTRFTERGSVPEPTPVEIAYEKLDEIFRGKNEPQHNMNVASYNILADDLIRQFYPAIDKETALMDVAQAIEAMDAELRLTELNILLFNQRKLANALTLPSFQDEDIARYYIRDRLISAFMEFDRDQLITNNVYNAAQQNIEQQGEQSLSNPAYVLATQAYYDAISQGITDHITRTNEKAASEPADEKILDQDTLTDIKEQMKNYPNSRIILRIPPGRDYKQFLNGIRNDLDTMDQAEADSIVRLLDVIVPDPTVVEDIRDRRLLFPFGIFSSPEEHAAHYALYKPQPGITKPHSLQVEPIHMAPLPMNNTTTTPPELTSKPSLESIIAGSSGNTGHETGMNDLEPRKESKTTMKPTTEVNISSEPESSLDTFIQALTDLRANYIPYELLPGNRTESTEYLLKMAIELHDPKDSRRLTYSPKDLARFENLYNAALLMVGDPSLKVSSHGWGRIVDNPALLASDYEALMAHQAATNRPKTEEEAPDEPAYYQVLHRDVHTLTKEERDDPNLPSIAIFISNAQSAYTRDEKINALYWFLTSLTKNNSDPGNYSGYLENILNTPYPHDLVEEAVAKVKAEKRANTSGIHPDRVDDPTQGTNMADLESAINKSTSESESFIFTPDRKAHTIGSDPSTVEPDTPVQPTTGVNANSSTESPLEIEELADLYDALQNLDSSNSGAIQRRIRPGAIQQRRSLIDEERIERNRNSDVRKAIESARGTQIDANSFYASLESRFGLQTQTIIHGMIQAIDSTTKLPVRVLNGNTVVQLDYLLHLKKENE